MPVVVTEAGALGVARCGAASVRGLIPGVVRWLGRLSRGVARFRAVPRVDGLSPGLADWEGATFGRDSACELVGGATCEEVLPGASAASEARCSLALRAPRMPLMNAKIATTPTSAATTAAGAAMRDRRRAGRGAT